MRVKIEGNGKGNLKEAEKFRFGDFLPENVVEKLNRMRREKL